MTQPDTPAPGMSLEVALDFADNPKPYHTLAAPADTNGELYEALAVLAQAYRSARRPEPAADAVEAVKAAVLEQLQVVPMVAAPPDVLLRLQAERLAIAAIAAMPGVGWKPIESAPRDGSQFLAVLGQIDDERWQHLSGRMFVIRFVPGGDWALFPGFGIGDEWIAGWHPLPPAPAKE